MSCAAGLVRRERGLSMHGGQQEAWQKVVFTWWRRASQQQRTVVNCNIDGCPSWLNGRKIKAGTAVPTSQSGVQSKATPTS